MHLSSGRRTYKRHHLSLHRTVGVPMTKTQMSQCGCQLTVPVGQREALYVSTNADQHCNRVKAMKLKAGVHVCKEGKTL